MGARRREQLHRPPASGTDGGESGFDDLDELRGRRQGAEQTPDPVVLDESPGGECSEDQLAQEQRVAARRRPQRGRRRRLHRGAQREVEQRVHLDLGEVDEIDAQQLYAAKEVVDDARPGLARAHRANQEDHSRIHQLTDEGQRRRIQSGQVVDHQHERPSVRPRSQGAGDGGVQRHGVGSSVNHLAWQEVGECAEGSEGGRGACRGSPGAPSLTLCGAERFLGEA